jgi:hypothetical protein
VNIRNSGGCASVATSVDDVRDVIESLKARAAAGDCAGPKGRETSMEDRLMAESSKIPSEKSITLAIVKYLKSQGCWTLKVHGGPYQRRAVPDILACVNGHFLAIEGKRPKYGRLTKLQESELVNIRNSGGCASVATSVDDVRDVIESLKARANVIAPEN